MAMPTRNSARSLDDRRIKQALSVCRDEREELMLLFSLKAGLRAIEMAGLTWDRVDIDGGMLLLKKTKGDKPRNIPIAPLLMEAIIKYRATRAGKDAGRDRVFVNRQSKPGSPLTPNAIAQWFRDFYVRRLGWEGYSSHSGRRTFATRVARNIGAAGGSIHDLKELLGHNWLSTTQLYIDSDEDAQKRLMDMI